MRMPNRILAAALGLSLIAGSAIGASHENKANEAAIKARKAHMQLYAFNLGVLGAMAKGEMEYNAEAAQGAAGNISALTKMNQGAFWPQDSDSLSAENTRALPDIWENFPDVMEKSNALVQAATAMDAAAGTDLASLQGAIGPLGQACGACHKKYRQPE
ncbi:c-type cytochrome [Actibacterium lipolyticum]|uniref:Cytochrome c-554 n=1 Tax=Actibacterium lipolyticum TaxID=1524263 RepID=A0A238JZ66_9RHOB|nr:cytochrome c [Actibacterium lipolyticum]SMX35152.1 Cytochrome c-554 precursor [Actibacterium lipolyticum]